MIGLISKEVNILDTTLQNPRDVGPNSLSNY